jgi:NAD(P)-dependent dehydrogenase (short-subunit alcohol dehydrogenase family)
MDFKGTVVVITGAGRGLGYEYARYFASRGARLVLNDLGREGDNYVVDFVAKNLQSEFGAQVVTNHDSVEFGEKIIEAAIKAFGRIDVLINNAGILVDKSMVKIKSEDFDLINKVHVKGTFRCTLAAWPHFRKQKYGRVINTGSSSGLFGNFGQVNYSAAKAAIHGMTMSLAKEGENSNIKVNTIAPVAATSMTQGVIQEDILKAIHPRFVVPLVAVLAGKDCPENGGMYEVGGGWITKLRYQRAEGLQLTPDASPEDILKNWDKVGDFTRNSDYPSAGSDSLERMFANYERTAKLRQGTPKL